MNKIGTKLRTLREIHNYKQEYVGSVIGLSQTGYGKIENGEVENISIKHLQKLAELYNLTVEQLFSWDGKVVLGNTFNNTQGNDTKVTEDRIKQLEAKVDVLMTMIMKSPIV